MDFRHQLRFIIRALWEPRLFIGQHHLRRRLWLAKLDRNRIDGLPVISAQDTSTRALKVTHCGDVACSSGNTSVTVDDPDNYVGSYSSLAIGINGFPIISYIDSTAQALKVAFCGDSTCSSGNTITTVDDPRTTSPATPQSRSAPTVPRSLATTMKQPQLESRALHKRHLHHELHDHDRGRLRE